MARGRADGSLVMLLTDPCLPAGRQFNGVDPHLFQKGGG